MCQRLMNAADAWLLTHSPSLTGCPPCGQEEWFQTAATPGSPLVCSIRYRGSPFHLVTSLDRTTFVINKLHLVHDMKFAALLYLLAHQIGLVIVILCIYFILRLTSQ